MSAGAALKAIDGAAKVDGQAKNWQRTRVTTPEMRLLQRHHDLMGDDDAKRIARLDPSQHKYGCRCAMCDRAERVCPIDGCGKVVVGRLQLAEHLERHRTKVRKASVVEQRARKRREHAGLTFVAALVGDADRASALDLRALRELEHRLREHAAWHRGRLGKRVGAVRNALATLQTLAPEAPTELTTTVEAQVAVVVHRLALLAGVTPRTVAAALVIWGIDRFADDAKRARGAAPPHIAKALTAPGQQGACPPGLFATIDEGAP